MRPVRFLLSAAVVVLLGLGWQAQRETNRRLDALAAAVAARPEQPPAPPAPLPALLTEPHTGAVVPAAGQVPRELEKVALPPHVIEAPDMLTVEVGVQDRASGEVKPLPELGGAHLVRPDGTINLGVYGTATVAGLTLDKAAAAVRKVVAERRPGTAVDQVAAVVSVQSYNSKCYYVITDGGETGEQMYRLPCTGNECVLDAMAQLSGLRPTAPKVMWVARPAAAGGGHQVLPVDWAGITQRGETATNYQLLPGDRLYVKAGK
ncbi:MAG: polysaccharide biosynthesis/export family protein [Gemmataceae bacterium]|nr:polysaccharide biosynthesis/export family protein [Gemmataceae bacterium]